MERRTTGRQNGKSKAGKRYNVRDQRRVDQDGEVVEKVQDKNTEPRQRVVAHHRLGKRRMGLLQLSRPDLGEPLTRRFHLVLLGQHIQVRLLQRLPHPLGEDCVREDTLATEQVNWTPRSRR